MQENTLVTYRNLAVKYIIPILGETPVDQLIKTCPKFYSLLLEFLLMSGLRWGEATALQRKDLKMEDAQIIVSVDKAWKKMPGGFTIGVPKTRASLRSFSLP